MTENTQVKSLRAGNTVESLKPKEATDPSFNLFMKLPSDWKPVTSHVDSQSGEALYEQVGETLSKLIVESAPQNSELNSPDIDECAPIITQHVNENFQLAAIEVSHGASPAASPSPWDECVHSFEDAAQLEEEPEVIPATNIWNLRWRITKLEEQVDELLHRIAQHNIRSSWKI